MVAINGSGGLELDKKQENMNIEYCRQDMDAKMSVDQLQMAAATLAKYNPHSLAKDFNFDQEFIDLVNKSRKYLNLCLDLAIKDIEDNG